MLKHLSPERASSGLANFSVAGILSLTAMVSPPLNALAPPSENCSEPQTENCAAVTPFVEGQLKKPLKTLPNELAPILKAQLPDLIASVRAERVRLEPGDTVGVRFILQNIGSAPAEFGETDAAIMRLILQAPADSFGGYLSEGEEGGGPEQLYKVTSPRLIPPREHVDQIYSLAIPNNSSRGVYRLCAIADPESEVRESNEENNRGCVDLHIAAAPDSQEPTKSRRIEIPAKRILPHKDLTPPPVSAPDRKDENGASALD